MNHRTRGIVIALSSAAAGALIPAAVSAEIAAGHFTAIGLGIIAFLNLVIALIHIKEPVEFDRRLDDDKVETKRTSLATVGSVNAEKREGAS
jgi:hypothetical protein